MNSIKALTAISQAQWFKVRLKTHIFNSENNDIKNENTALRIKQNRTTQQQATSFQLLQNCCKSVQQKTAPYLHLFDNCLHSFIHQLPDPCPFSQRPTNNQLQSVVLNFLNCLEDLKQKIIRTVYCSCAQLHTHMSSPHWFKFNFHVPCIVFLTRSSLWLPASVSVSTNQKVVLQTCLVVWTTKYNGCEYFGSVCVSVKSL